VIPIKEEIVFSGWGNAVGYRGTVAVQVRTGPLTDEALGWMATSLRLWNVVDGRTRRALLAVLGPDAPIPTGEVAKKQRELVSSIRAWSNGMTVLTLEGEGIGVGARRAFYRLLSLNTNVVITADVATGARTIARDLGLPGEAAELGRFVQRLRELTTAR
jgi:hypothetical protein